MRKVVVKAASRQERFLGTESVRETQRGLGPRFPKKNSVAPATDYTLRRKSGGVGASLTGTFARSYGAGGCRPRKRQVYRFVIRVGLKGGKISGFFGGCGPAAGKDLFSGWQKPDFII